MDGERPASLLRMTVEHNGDWAVVRLAGELDYTTVEPVRECRDRLLSEGRPRIALELSALDFCDSVGFALFAETWKLSKRAGGQMVLLRPTGHVERMVTVMGMGKFVADPDELSRPREPAQDDAELRGCG